jgi:hypothetical protein
MNNPQDGEIACWFDLDHIFGYHDPAPEGRSGHEAVLVAAKDFARAIVANTPFGEDQKAAIGAVRQAVMFASAAITLRGRLRPCPMMRLPDGSVWALLDAEPSCIQGGGGGGGDEAAPIASMENSRT